MSKLISLDTSTTCTGMAVCVDDKLVKVEKLITPDCIDGWTKRLDWMGKTIIERVYAEKPNVIAVEAMVVGNTNTTRMLSEVVGIARSAAIMVNADFFEYNPSVWRKACLDEGEISPESLAGKKFIRDDWKNWSLERVNLRYVKTVTNDVADAVLIGVAHINSSHR